MPACSGGARNTVIESRTSDILNVFASGAGGGGLVEELCGSNLEGVGIEPAWAGVAVVVIRVEGRSGPPAERVWLHESLEFTQCTE
jgi:hypothetical protein